MFGDFDWMDINHDGEVDVFERELVFGPVESTYCEEEEDEVEEALASVGLDRYDLADMDEEERREALEEAGPDADDWE